ncbi:MAG: hypothetical protein LBO06_01770 [Bacteroidales bacterium]|jgi:hypothetical protein|nr:hypothetical protein [Bacteroidales bacterium]
MAKNDKKHLIVSYYNLTGELQSQFNDCYPTGYADFVQKITKPNGDTIFVVPFETADASYMVKVDVKIDNRFSEEEFERGLFNTEDEDEETNTADSETGEGKSKIVLMHGDYSSVDRADEPSE